MRIYLGATAALLLGAASILLGYQSERAQVLGRYSFSYAVLVGACLLGALLIAATAVVPGRWSERAHGGLGSAMKRLLCRRWVLGSSILALWAVAISAAAGLMQAGYFSRSLALHVICSALIVWVTFGFVIIASPDRRTGRRRSFKYAVVLVMGAASFVGVEMALRMSIGLLPGSLIKALPHKGEPYLPFYEFDDGDITVAYRYKPGVKLSQSMKASEAGLFVQQRHLVQPMAAGDDRVLTSARFTTDELGYRNSTPLKESYSIAVSGDSFTSYSVNPSPWPVRLAEALGSPVLNLGMQGYGPQSEVEALIRFGLPRKPRWVLLAYYEGNDLTDAQRYEEKRASGMGWAEHDLANQGIAGRFLAAHVLRYLVKQAFAESPAESEDGQRDYPYPFTARFGGKDIDLAFLRTYLTLHSMPRAEIEKLSCFRAAIDSIGRLGAACKQANAQLIVIYCPTKERCYLPLLPRELAAARLAGARRYVPAADGRMAVKPDQGPLLAIEDLLGNLDAQHAAVTSALEADGIEVLDLTPELRKAVAAGVEVYWTMDNHWSPHGDEVAAQAVLKRVQAEGGK